MIVGGYRDLFLAIGTCAATLIGLLFVAVSIAQGREETHPREIQEFRAAAALLAFVNAFTVALFGMVPGTDVGYPAVSVAAIGLLFTAAGVRTILSQPFTRQQRRSQLSLIGSLLVLFGVQLVFAIELLLHRHGTGTLELMSYVLLASLLIGIGRAWELVGDWDTGALASLLRLLGRPTHLSAGQQDPPASSAAAEG